MSLFTGHYSRSSYDKCAYPDQLTESTGIYKYTVNSDRIHNCDGCLTVYGPRGGVNGAGVSTVSGHKIAGAQQNIDIDTIMSNRNLPISKCKKGRVNPVDIKKIKTKHMPVCNDYLDSQHTKMTDPAMFYRGAPINRHFDLPRNPQANIYYDWGVNTTLEARDNFVPVLPVPMNSDTVPRSGNYTGDMTINSNHHAMNVGCRNNTSCGKRRIMNRELLQSKKHTHTFYD
jgi:hypothetical protein